MDHLFYTHHLSEPIITSSIPAWPLFAAALAALVVVAVAALIYSTRRAAS